jgi:transcriptional regulator with XRE-family HTH domain
MDARAIVLEARRGAKLSQRELSRRSGIPQAAISRIEAAMVSPTASTLDRLLRACGRDLQVVERAGSGVDRSLIRERLAISVAQRARRAALEWRRTRVFARSVPS